jgi:hypothetical protein
MCSFDPHRKSPLPTKRLPLSGIGNTGSGCRIATCNRSGFAFLVVLFTLAESDTKAALPALTISRP